LPNCPASSKRRAHAGGFGHLQPSALDLVPLVAPAVAARPFAVFLFRLEWSSDRPHLAEPLELLTLAPAMADRRFSVFSVPNAAFAAATVAGQRAIADLLLLLSSAADRGRPSRRGAIQGLNCCPPLRR